MTKLNIETLVANVKGRRPTMQVSDLSDAGLTKLVEYGFQRFLNDACGGDKTDEEIDGIVAKRLEGLKTGNLGASRAGRKADLRSKAEYNVLLAYLGQKMKASAAKELAKEWAKSEMGIWGEFFAAMRAARVGKKVSGFDQNDWDEVEVIRKANWAKVEEKIEAERAKLEEAAKPVEVDLDFEF